MYEPNPEVLPTGAEVDEFLDVPEPHPSEPGPAPTRGEPEPTDGSAQ